MQRREFLSTAIGLAACSSSEPRPIPAGGEASPPPAVAPVGGDGEGGAAPASGDPPQPASDPGPPDDPGVPGDTFLLGVVGQRGARTCPDGGTRQWLNVVPTVGSVRVGGVPDDEAAALMGQPVVAIGTPAAAPALPEVEVADCPPMQMREDWVETPQGMRIRREPRPGFDYFEVASIRRLTEITAKQDGDDVVVTLGNPLPVRLEFIRLTLHYEGCYGKPGTHASTPKVAPVDPGASRPVRWPLMYEDASGRSYRAASVQLSATAEGAVFDLDIPLRALGLPFDCPGRGKGKGTGTKTKLR